MRGPTCIFWANLTPFSLQLRREVGLLRAIVHPNVVRLHAVLSSPSRAFLVTELCDTDLQRHLAARPPLNYHEARRLMRQLAAAMAALRARGIVHRDLKPQNLLLAFPAGSQVEHGPTLLPMKSCCLILCVRRTRRTWRTRC